jgi:hypothetical protein
MSQASLKKSQGADAEEVEFDEEDDKIRKPEHELSIWW